MKVHIKILGQLILILILLTTGIAFAAEYSYYEALANHTRSRGINPDEEINSSFNANLTMVRVPLPSESKVWRSIIKTKIGKVDFKRDHLIDSIETLNEYYGKSGNGQLAYKPERVDLITSARFMGFRFAAISIYLGYRFSEDALPSFYILEAGRATGEPMALFFSDRMDKTIEGPATFKPTPFASVKNIYRGNLYMREDDPRVLNIWVRSPTPDAKPYIRVRAAFRPVLDPKPQYAATLILEAQSRIAALARKMRVKGQDIGKAFLKAAQKLEWIVYPERKQD
jgi:hypothetical protein